MGAAAAAFLVPPIADLAALSMPPRDAMAVTVAVAAATIPLLTVVLRRQVDAAERMTS